MNYKKTFFILSAALLLNACVTNSNKQSDPVTVYELPPQEEAQASAAEVTAKPKERIVLTFAGDTTLGQDKDSGGMTFDWEYKTQKDPSYFLKLMKPLFETDDITILNFEGTLTEATDAANKQFRFKGPADYAKILSSSSVEMVNLANNHTFDYGKQGYDDTKTNLVAENIEYFGYDEVIIKEVKGTRLCFNGVKGWAPGRDGPMLKRNFAKFKDNCDFIATTFHWGDEREYTHNKMQEGFAIMAVKEGADIVIGHHAHVVQDKEMRSGVPVYYGLGNFLFGGNKNSKDKRALAVQVILEDGKIVKLIEYDLLISSVPHRNNYQPVMVNPHGPKILPQENKSVLKQEIRTYNFTGTCEDADIFAEKCADKHCQTSTVKYLFL
ncbi:poly-gamma-glutamate synthesis protein (capsule biosynthesis protein) [Elusimicrobium posterum]|uniref:CapA family protein n=1 Tax=Elusimicrobium posterum TaxID=3116653 RepID=UPI003C77C2F3